MEKRLLSATTSRRVSCPWATQQIWDAIKIIRYQRQVPNLDRISRYMSRVHNVKEDEVSMHLNNCVSDNLIRLIKKVGSKGSKIGVAQEGYGLPKEKIDKDESDWYCFECHAGGDVVCCTACHRVFHLHCLNLAELPEDDLKNTFVCPVCKKCDMNNEAGLMNMKQQRLNRLVRYICAHVSGLLPAELTSRKVPTSASYLDKSISSPTASTGESTSSSWETDSDDSWRGDLLIRKPIDMATMQSKAVANEYQRIEQFQADVQTLLHNVVVYHGSDDELSMLVRRIVSDVTYDVAEVRQCPDCYAASNEQRGKAWFCRPCRPPHDLVWAKQKTFPFWPAKVIRIDGTQYDVRFFGGQHQRAMIPQSGIRPIETNVKSLQVKRTAGWIKACEELRFHQQQLEEQARKGPTAESSDDEDDIPLEFVEVLPRASKAKRSYTKRTAKRKKVVESDMEQSDADEDESKTRKDEEESTQDSQSDDSSSESAANERIPVLKEGQSQEDMVSSSCQEPQFSSIAVQTSLRSPKAVAREKKTPLKSALAKARKEAEQEKKTAIAEALRELEEQLSQEHLLEIQQLKEEHAAEISEVKLKQWCFNCEKEAIYHCCWNTAYCSIQCQQEHWTTEHKPHCRRKR